MFNKWYLIIMLYLNIDSSMFVYILFTCSPAMAGRWNIHI